MGIFSWFSNKNKTTEVIQQPRVSKKRKPWHQDKCKGSGTSLLDMYHNGYYANRKQYWGRCQGCNGYMMSTKRGTSWPHKAPTTLDIYTKS